MRLSLYHRLGLIAGLALGCRAAPQPEKEGVEQPTPARPLVAGDAAPDFAVLSHIGYSVGVRDFGERPVLVQLCPDGFDAACIELARALRDNWLKLNQRLGMALFVVPLGNIEGRAFASAEELPFLVLSDQARAVAQAFGVGEASRAGFLIGQDHHIARILPAANPPDYIQNLTSALP